MCPPLSIKILMKFRTAILVLIPLVVLVGCSSQSDTPSTSTDPNAKATPDQQIQKIQDDSNMPDGLKKIKTETLQNQPGAKR